MLFYFRVFANTPGRRFALPYFWNNLDNEHEGTCIDFFGEAFGIAIKDIIVDPIIISLPLPYIAQLKLCMKKTMSCLLFSLGHFPAASAPGVRDLMRANQQCYSYFDGTAAGGMDAVNRFGDYVAAHGPFDTVLAFSLGGALVSIFLLRPETGNERLQQAKRHIRTVVFINSIMPSAWDELEKNGGGQVTILRAARVAAENTFIDIPTIHA
ncbi:hypothetical protein B0T26DRAFT_750869 [Lasiosphaeria miniovina]|uniref:Serine hydrolase FSH domain-containing protein n=1 Tax=Lasiosphaeria miniovina TaxID=1954250 RepID=A0AA40AX46_9PEZI|nr:uncharacterized protein B0T26DRAFT_750869 [Lasiosphaeria miniovina]KAK0723610.1 hypothetical protein B0T26DRAFT_750869 [Lasiosphaeria miniovina]